MLKEKLEVLLDVDTGIDDSIALLYALKNANIHVNGITTGFGNVSAQQATENTLRILKLADPGYDVPVITGAEKPLRSPWSGPAIEVHGENGIGNVELPPSSQQPLMEAVEDFIARIAERANGDLVVVTAGRLTNLAMALQKHPALKNQIERVVSMGGTIYAPGNVSPCAEANIAGDPEAAEYVLSSGLDITLVGLDVTMKTRLTRQMIQDMKRRCDQDFARIWDYVGDVMQHYMAFYRMIDDCEGNCPIHDPSAVIAALKPELFTMRQMKAHIECSGQYCRGKVVTDLRTHPFAAETVHVCLDVDVNGMLNELFATLGG